MAMQALYHSWQRRQHDDQKDHWSGEMPDADGHARSHAGRREHEERDPNHPPVQSQRLRNSKPSRMSPSGQRHGRSERQQSKKTEWRFQHQYDRKVKPNPVRVAMTKNESRAAGTDRKNEQPAKIEPWRHEQPAHGYPSVAVP